MLGTVEHAAKRELFDFSYLYYIFVVCNIQVISQNEPKKCLLFVSSTFWLKL